ncbi:hypothetical protein Q8A67_024787 [Cirrhinus molitorella]|uniref:Uncharacterized protein n=1 Tax=Cirrhinus molitorella TaxID=172907 RepID=A0AA88TKH6_9TELE|nr:hypothetical protein Q8A67_024787 [Cirrhinus molitorella]
MRREVTSAANVNNDSASASRERAHLFLKGRCVILYKDVNRDHVKVCVTSNRGVIFILSCEGETQTVLVWSQ